MKRTAYQITGQSFDLPAAHLLPDGLEVKAVTVDLPAVEVAGTPGHTLNVWEIHPGRRVGVTIHTLSGEAGMSVDLNSARQVRDCLNAILEGDEELKVYREGDPKPEYSYTRRLLDSGQKGVGGNVYRRLWHGGGPLFHAEGRSGWSWSELLKDYGPLTEVNP